MYSSRNTDGDDVNARSVLLAHVGTVSVSLRPPVIRMLYLPVPALGAGLGVLKNNIDGKKSNSMLVCMKRCGQLLSFRSLQGCAQHEVTH